MTTLNTNAVAALASAGLTVTDWARHNHMDGEWCGDACGCPDSRCIGFHHDGPDDCGCLSTLLDDVVASPPAVEPGQIWMDSRGRYLRVDEITDKGQAAMVVVAQLIGDRVMAPMRAVSMDVAKVSKRMMLVDGAPKPTGPDIATASIDYAAQTIDLGAGPVPYYVGSSGPRVRFTDHGDGSALITLTLYVGQIRSDYGGGQ